MNTCATALGIAIFFCGACAPDAAAQRRTVRRSATPPEMLKNVFWQPNELQQGSPAFFTVEFARVPRHVTATWIGKELMFFHTSNPRIWYALAGADIETQPGNHDLVITARMLNGHVAHATKAIEVKQAQFGTGEVQVPENYVEPNATEQKQIAGDDELKKRALAHLVPTPQWSGNFAPPVNAKPTPSFGESRLLNEERTSTHRGTDYPVPESTPVVAANSGTVVLATALYYEGNCVIIDHGQHLFTIYMHFKQIDVHAGDKVKKGDRLGLSGATGRVTGPHFHLGVRWNGADLDPVELLALTLPKTSAAEEPHRRTSRRGMHRR